MKIFMTACADGRVKATNAVTGEWIAPGDYLRIMSLLYGRGTVVQR